MSSTVLLVVLAFVFGAGGFAAAQSRPSTAPAGRPGGNPAFRKLGTIGCDVGEAAPFVFHGRLYRLEAVPATAKANRTGQPHLRVIDVRSGEAMPPFAAGRGPGRVLVRGELAYAYAVDRPGGASVCVYTSRDLKTWSGLIALDTPGWGIGGLSVCQGHDRFVMALQVDGPLQETGMPPTIRFAESADLMQWKLTPPRCVFSRDRYTAAPCLRCVEGLYYLIYVEERPGPTYEPHIVRSTDLMYWEPGRRNPLMHPSVDDQNIACPALAADRRDAIAKAADVENTRIDLCEFEGRLILHYIWGTPQGPEFLAEAEFHGTLREFLREFFPPAGG